MSTQKRNKIFEVFSQNLALVTEKLGIVIMADADGCRNEIVDPLYICPLCRRGFLRESLNQSLDNPLTLEDVPPESLGGKPLILTCKKCNNTAGTKLDKPLLNHLKESAFLKVNPLGEVKGRVWVNNLRKIPATIKIGPNREWMFQVDLKNPIAKSHIQELQNNQAGNKINFDFSVTKKDLVANALLRIGYLIAFNFFGNQLLIAEENINPVLEQINNPDKKILPHSSVSELKVSDSIKDGLNILKNPLNFKSYFSVFTLTIDSTTRQFGVFLPGPGKDGWEKYENLKNFKKDTEMIFHDISFRDMIKDKKLVCGYSEIWNHI